MAPVSVKVLSSTTVTVVPATIVTRLSMLAVLLAVSITPPLATSKPFLDCLAREDLAPATLRGYRYDLRHFLAWHATVQPDAFALDHLAAFELIAYRQHMVAAGRRPATINRRLDALRRLCLPPGPARNPAARPLLTRPSTLRAIRYRALLRGWAFHP